MLALSPSSFSTNIAYWPLEDPIGHDDQHYFYRDIEPTNSDQSLYHNFPAPPASDQQSRAKTISNRKLHFPLQNAVVSRPTTPSTTADVSSDLNMAVKKLNHNASERDRRKKINHLYSSLRALLPASDHVKKQSIPVTISRVLKYIPELQQQVEKLVQEREELLSVTNLRQQRETQVQQEINNQTKSKSRTSLSSVSVIQLNDKEAVVQISTLKFDKNPLSEMLHNLEEDGLSMLNASSFESFGGRIFHNLHLQVEESNSFECGTLSGKLMSLYDDKELLI